MFKGTRMIVPKLLREDMNHLLHVDNLSIVKVKEKALNILCWPGIRADLENIANSCDTGQEYQNQQKDEINSTLYFYHSMD